MPYITFDLTSPCKSFSATAETDEWQITFDGISRAPPGHGRSFKIVSGNSSFDGYGADAVLHIYPRPSRSVSKGISAANPFHPDQTGRDVIHLTCPASPNERPIFQISIHLPHEAYERLIETDLGRTKILLSLENELFNQALTYGEDPDGKEIEWDVDKASYVYLRSIRLSFLPRRESEAENVDRRTELDLARLLGQVEKITLSNAAIVENAERLSRMIIKAYWLIGAVALIALLTAVA